MKNNIFKFIFLILFILFISLYIATSFGYYKSDYKYKVTNENINKLEEDIKNNKKINASNYLVKDRNYNNILSFSFLKLSNLIGYSFDFCLRKIIKDLDNSRN